MIPLWPGLFEASQEKGWQDGIALAPFSPLLPEHLSPDSWDGYNSSYWMGVAHAAPQKERA